MEAVAIGLVLLALTCVSSVLRKAVSVPLPILQIVLGAAAALLPLHFHVKLDPHTFLLLLVPPLLFLDGWRVPRRELKQLRWPLLGNAVGLVFLTVLVGGYVIRWTVPGMTLASAFALAAVVSPTDAVALGAVTKGIGVPPRMRVLLESEALLNDASGLVALRFAVAAAVTGQFSAVGALGSFVVIAAGGIITGVVLAVGYGYAARILSLDEEEEPVLAVLSALLPFLAYWLAEKVGVSGILAAVAAGMTANRLGFMENMHWTARMQGRGMWRMIGYTFNGIVFVLLGAQLPDIVGTAQGGVDLAHVEAPWRIGVQVVGLTGLVLAIRFVWVLVSVSLERLAGMKKHTADWRVIAASSVGGVRGAITLAGVLSLPLMAAGGMPFPGRDIAITLATGVILLSLLLAWLLLPLLLRGVDSEELEHGREVRLARTEALRAAIGFIEQEPDGADPRRRRLLAAYRGRLAASESSGEDELREEEDRWRVLHADALAAERRAVQGLRDSHRINDEVAREVLIELDLLEAASAHRPLRLRIPFRQNKT